VGVWEVRTKRLAREPFFGGSNEHDGKLLDKQAALRLWTSAVGLHSAKRAPLCANSFCNLLDKGQRQILLNLGDVNYIDSSGLGSLVSAFTSVRKQNGELKLLNLTNKVPRCDANYKAVYRLRHHE